MMAINSALEIDLTGQATAESLGKIFYSGVGGQADFMRGAVLAPGGKTILAIQSTAQTETVSRIVPFLSEGAGVTLIRGDIHYVVTEYGIAYLHGKNIRERAMELIAIAHPKFRPWLIEEAKKASFIYSDQAFIPGEKGRYPEELETYRKTKTGMDHLPEAGQDHRRAAAQGFLLRPLRPEPLPTVHLDAQGHAPRAAPGICRHRLHPGDGHPGRRRRRGGKRNGRRSRAYDINPDTQTAEVAFAVRDDYQNKGIGTELLSYLTYLARRQGLLGFTAEVLVENKPMLHVFEKGGFELQRHTSAGLVELKMTFKQEVPPRSQKLQP